VTSVAKLFGPAARSESMQLQEIDGFGGQSGRNFVPKSNRRLRRDGSSFYYETPLRTVRDGRSAQPAYRRPGVRTDRRPSGEICSLFLEDAGA
jgi:hypothetical protein